MFKKNYKPWNKGKKYPAITGNKHPNWSGGPIEQHCIICNKVFYINKARLGIAKFCSKKCCGISKIDKPTWNKGTKGIMKPNSGSFKEHKIKNNTKYVSKYVPKHPQRIVRMHRYTMEQHLGRFLKPKEVVHHIDGNKSNNHISNLFLFSSEASHQKFHYLKDQQLERINTSYTPNAKQIYHLNKHIYL